MALTPPTSTYILLQTRSAAAIARCRSVSATCASSACVETGSRARCSMVWAAFSGAKWSKRHCRQRRKSSGGLLVRLRGSSAMATSTWRGGRRHRAAASSAAMSPADLGTRPGGSGVGARPKARSDIGAPARIWVSSGTVPVLALHNPSAPSALCHYSTGAVPAQHPHGTCMVPRP